MSLFSKLFARKTAPPPVPALPAGVRVYAIGDIHGRDDLFAALIDQIDADSAARGAIGEVCLILLGDLIDRGPESRAVVERAIALQAGRGLRAIKGNHEEALLSALEGDEKMLEKMRRFGGDATMISYGMRGVDAEGLDADTLVWRLASLVPQAHFDFFKAMESQIRIGDYLFVHAGIRPGVPFHLQKGQDLRWIRDGFLGDESYHGAMIVHGHSISAEPQLLANRLGIDTGAYESNVLTALGLEGQDRWLLQT